MTQKTLLHSGGDGTAVPEGLVGSTYTLSGSYNYASAQGYKSITPVGVLIQKGTYLVTLEVSATTSNVKNLCLVTMTTNAVNDSSGRLGGDFLNGEARPHLVDSTTVANSSFFSVTFIKSFSSDTTIYLKTYLEDVDTRTISGKMEAVRLA